MSVVSTPSSTDCVHFGNVAGADSLTVMTIAATIKTGTLGASIYGIAGMLEGAALTGWEFRLDASNRLEFLVGTAAGAVTANDSNVLADDTIYSVMVSWDGSNAQFSIDGVLKDSPALVATMGATAGSTFLGIGGRYGSGTRGFNTTVQDVVVWDVALEGADPAASYHVGAIPQPEDMVFWAQMHSSLTEQDRITGVAGTVVNSPTLGAPLQTLGRAIRKPMSRPFMMGWGPLIKVIDEDENVAEAVERYLGILKVIDEDENLADGVLLYNGFLMVVDDTVSITDGTTTSEWSPDGVLTETMSDGTVWTTKFPPFIRKTQWT
jgi:hypothetical protein